jgi:hypothetical protein
MPAANRSQLTRGIDPGLAFISGRAKPEREAASGCSPQTVLLRSRSAVARLAWRIVLRIGTGHSDQGVIAILSLSFPR